MMEHELIQRRTFLKSTGGALALSAASSMKVLGANERVSIGLIGCGGRGADVMRAFMRCENVEVVAVCDVDENRMPEDIQRIEEQYGKKPEVFRDHRAMLERKDIDLVIVGTPDHWHTLITLDAVMAGKHVYVEKVASHNIRESRMLIRAAEKYEPVIQVGCQRRNFESSKQGVAYIREGRLGKVNLVRTCTQVNSIQYGPRHEPDEEHAPPGVDYDRWLGPAPKRKFNRHRFHGSWRHFFDYGSGSAGDYNVHLLDVALEAMGNPYPLSVCASGGALVFPPELDQRTVPDTLSAVVEYPGFIYNYILNMGSEKKLWQKTGPDQMRKLSAFVTEISGSNGQLYADYGNMLVTPDSDRCEPIENIKHREDAIFHCRDMLEAIRNHREPSCPPRVHHAAATVSHLMNIAYRTGGKFYYDKDNETCFRDPEHTIPDREANALLGREYRRGYEPAKV